MGPASDRIETVRGRLGPETAAQLIAFWTGHGALDEASARRRLEQVVCIRRDRGGEIAGVNSVYAAAAPLIGRTLWIYRRFLPGAQDDDAERALLGAAYEALAQEFTGGAAEPIGVCVLIGDAAAMQRRPEAIWPDSRFTFAGYTETGEQVRVRYFDGAMI